jgi:metal-responsive CopG/Arc/MetJ family transcriptional regulator
MTKKYPAAKGNCRTMKAISITVPEDLLVILEDERHPKESRSRTITRLIMKGLELPDEDYFAIIELKKAEMIAKKAEEAMNDKPKKASDFHEGEPL